MSHLPKWAAKPFAKPYVAGESTDEVLEIVEDLNSSGFSATIDILGEFVENKDGAKSVRKQYEDLIGLIFKKKINSTISMKLTHIGLDLDYLFCKNQLIQLTSFAMKKNVGITIDMESSKYTDDIYKLYRTANKLYPKVGAVTQAYLHRSLNDVIELNGPNCNLRVCKGIYSESSEIAITDKKEINENFKLLVETILNGKGYVCIATHDLDLIKNFENFIQRHEIPPSRFEFQVLYGVPMKKKLDHLKEQGHKVTVYVPFGVSGFEYSIRRLKENPKVVSYVIKNFFNR